MKGLLLTFRTTFTSDDCYGCALRLYHLVLHRRCQLGEVSLLISENSRGSNKGMSRVNSVTQNMFKVNFLIISLEKRLFIFKDPCQFSLLLLHRIFVYFISLFSFLFFENLGYKNSQSFDIFIALPQSFRFIFFHFLFSFNGLNSLIDF